MLIRIAEHSGYCFGVKRAMELVRRAADRRPGGVFTLGEVIHNPRVVKELEKRGVRVAPGCDYGFPTGSAVVLPSHGAAWRDVSSLKSRGLEVVDATCPRVLAVQKRIKEGLERGRRVVVAGFKGHAEAECYAGMSRHGVVVVESAAQAKKLRARNAHILLAAQTTFSPGEFALMEDALRARAGGLEVLNSICGHTLSAQAAAGGLAKSCDKMIVIGGRNSSNTARLAEACEAAGAKSFRIGGASELKKRDFSDGDAVGITAGASTPPEHVVEVVGWLSERFDVKIVDGKEKKQKIKDKSKR